MSDARRRITVLRRVAGSALIAAALVGPTVAYLRTTAPDIADRPLSNDRLGLPTEPRGLLFSNGGVSARTVPLWRVGSDSLDASAFVDLLAGTAGTTPTVVGAELRIGTCVFRLPATTTLRDGETLRLARVQPCDDSQSAIGELAVSVRDTGAVQLWAWAMPADDEPVHGGLSLSPPDTPRLRWILRGRLQEVSGRRSVTRLALAAWLWETTASTLVGVCALAFLLAWAGTLLLAGLAERTGSVLHASTGGAAVALAVCLLWTVVIPPLQSADSIDHLLSFGEVTSDAAMPQKVRGLAHRVHFERIRMHRFEHVRPRDLEIPYELPWTGDVHAERMESRSPITARFWRLVAPVVAHASPAVTLQRLQWAHAVLFALAVGLSAGLLTWLAPRQGAWLLAGAALMPTLAYSATMLSDWAVLTTWTLLTGVACVLAMTATTRTAVAGAALGIGVVLMLGTGLSALTVLPVVVTVLGGRMLVGPSPKGWDPFWAGLGLALLLLPWSLGSLMDAGFQRYDAEGRPEFAGLLALVNRGVTWLGHQPWLLLVPVGLLAAVDRIAGALRQHRRLQAAASVASVWVAGAVTVVAVIELGWSLLRPLPMLPTFETYPWASTREYAEAVVHVGLTAARLDGFDHLTFTSLWGGFGWLDAILPPTLLRVIVGALVAGLVALWATPHAALRQTGLLALSAGTVGLASVAVASSLMQRNVHGRYLLPLALVVTVLTLAPAGAALRDTRHAWFRWGTAILLAALHGGSVWLVAMRYFG